MSNQNLNYRGSGFAININQFKILYKKRTSFLIATILISSKTMATTIIPFHELVPGSEGVRFTTVEGTPYMSVRDIIMVVCKKDSKRASETWINLSETYKNELSEFLGNFGNFQFPGRGQSPQPVITLPGALKLVMWLPGNMAKDFRTKACEILNRYIAGDASLVAEINANAVSTAPINEMARASLPEISSDPLMHKIASNVETMMQKFQSVEVLTSELTVAHQERDHERHLRHQADGRLGNETREVNKEVRKRAADADARAVAAEERATMERHEHLRSIQEITQHAAEERRAAAEERRTAAASHQLLAETLAKIMQRLT